jgi:hypothetical protein
MQFIELSRTNETAERFYVNVSHIVKFGSALNNNTMLIYYSDGRSESVLETDEEIIKLIKESRTQIVSEADKIA